MASNFTLKMRGPITLQMRYHGSEGWGPFCQPVDSVRASVKSKQPLFEFTTIESKKASSTESWFSSMLLSNRTTSTSSTSSTQGVSVYVSVAIGSCLCILVAFVSVLLLMLLTRNGHVKFLSSYLASTSSSSSSTSSTMTNSKSKLKLTGKGHHLSGSSGTNSECDSIDFIKRNHHHASAWVSSYPVFTL